MKATTYVDDIECKHGKTLELQGPRSSAFSQTSEALSPRLQVPARGNCLRLAPMLECPTHTTRLRPTSNAWPAFCTSIVDREHLCHNPLHLPIVGFPESACVPAIEIVWFARLLSESIVVFSCRSLWHKLSRVYLRAFTQSLIILLMIPTTAHVISKQQSRKMTSMSEKILEARARVKKIRSAPYTPLRRRRLRYAEGRLAILREALERGAREVRGAITVAHRLIILLSGCGLCQICKRGF